MIRSFKGTSLVFVLVALVAVKHAALGFCLCNQEFFLSGCNCETSPSHEDCGACPEEPCDSCEVPVSIEVEEFIWSADHIESKTTVVPAVMLPAPEVLPGRCAAPGASVIRGSPPGSPPLFLWASVLRL